MSDKELEAVEDENILAEDIQQEAVKAKKPNKIMDSFEGFLGSNKKIILYAVLPIFLIALLIVGLKFWYLPKQNKAAGAELAKLFYYYKNDSVNIVLKGSKTEKIKSAAEIADNYSWTKKGKEAAILAGWAFMKSGKFNEAIKYYDKTDAGDRMLGPRILAMKAACYSELNKFAKAASLYEKAADWGDNEFASEYYIMAARHFEMANEFKDGIRAAEKYYNKFPEGNKAADAQTLIYKLKAALGELTK